MRATVSPLQNEALRGLRPSQLDSYSRNFLQSILERIQRGKLTIVDRFEERSFGQETGGFSLDAKITVMHPRFYRDTVLGGSIGAAEAYMAGYWSADDLTNVLRIIVLNPEVFEGMDQHWANLSVPINRLYHLLNRGTKSRSKLNIVAHYDLGNDFYSLFLDETMTYSCGIFETPDSTLRDASIAKYDRICRKLQLNPADHVLEIGTGWGGFAVYAAQKYGCRITTTTISDAQFEFANELVHRSKLADRVKVVIEDYRDLAGKFDKLVSIEMIEAVGHQYLDAFFQCCSNRLKDEGIMALQAITIADRVYEKHKNSADFIKRYIFPGSCIPSIAAICSSVAKCTDLKLFHLEDITPHYARTLREWGKRFFANLEKVRDLGFSEAFIRMWEYYFCYCEAGFAERYLGDAQMIFTKPLCRREPLLPHLD